MGTTILEQQTASIFRAENASSVRKNEAVVPFKTLVTVSHTTHRHVVEDRNPVPEAVQYNFDLLTMSTWCSKHVQA